MAGPGGGPPRKSHTKSRKGCKTCKRRHIRCDETMPQCRNCTKHNCRCDYMDTFIAQEQAASPRCPDLLMSPEIEVEIDAWQRTGNPPFPELQPSSRNYWYRFSKTDLRLIHHISGLSIDLHRRGYSSCTVWAQKMPIFLAIALSSEFVMSSILALSASHLAWMTQNQDTEHLAYHHRGVALKGLHEAIGTFSRENSDAILAASLLLSWQATEWRSWASLQQGVSTVLNSMQPWWKDESELARFMESQRAFRSARTPLTPTYPGGMAQFHSEDIMRLDRILASLQNIHQRISHNQEHYRRITDLLSFAHRLREDLPVQSPEKAFERLQPLRTWLFWLPPTMLRGGDTDLGALAVLSQFFGLALALEPIFPEFGGSYLGSMSVTPIEDIRKILFHRRATNPFAPDVPLALSLMELPGEIVAEYRSRLQWSPRASLDAYSSGSHSPYQSLPTPHLPPTPTTLAHYPAYTTSPLHSPLTPAIVGSPYSIPNVLDSRRQSHAYLTTSPNLTTDPIDDRTAEYKHHPHDQHPAVFNPAYLGNLIHPAPPMGLDYAHTTQVDLTGGLVAPELCWT